MSDDVAEEVEFVEAGTLFECKLCEVVQYEPLVNKQYCQKCSDHLHQAYQWLQSPMLSASELKKLQQKILDLTDVNNIIFE